MNLILAQKTAISFATIDVFLHFSRVFRGFGQSLQKISWILLRGLIRALSLAFQMCVFANILIVKHVAL